MSHNKYIYSILLCLSFVTFINLNGYGQQTPTAESFYQLGKKAQESGNIEDAVLAYTSALDLDSKHTAALYNRGAAYFSMSKYGKALADFNAVLLLQPDDKEAIERRGNVRFMMGQFAEAVEDYTVLLNEKTSPDLLINRAIALKENGQYARANEDFDYAIRLDPTALSAWSGKGECCFLQKKYEDASFAYAKAVEIKPTHYRRRYGFGLTNLKTGNYEVALQNLEEAYKLQPDATTAATLAYCNFKLNNLEKAESFANLAHNMDVRCADAYNVMGLIALQRNTLELAQRLFEETLTWTPTHADALYNLGYTRFLLRNFIEAKADLDKSIAQEPGNGNAYYARASVKIMLDDPNGACSDYQLAQQLTYTPFAEDDASVFCQK